VRCAVVMRGTSIPFVDEATSSIAEASAAVPVVFTDMPCAKAQFVINKETNVNANK